MTRSEDRASYPQDIRIQLIEQDLDSHEKLYKALEGRLAGIQSVLIGILVSVTTASILLVINLAAK